MNRCIVVCLLLTFSCRASRGDIVAQFRTYFGDIDVQLFAKDKPATVANFLDYVRSGRYRDSFFHRCDTNHTLLQGGGYFIMDRGNPDQSFEPIENFGVTIPNEYGRGTIYSNRYGTLAAFHPTGQTNGASSQWFFNLRDNPAFDAPTTNGYFTVFGRVIGGTNVLNTFLGFQVWKETPQETNVIVDLCKYAGFGPDFRECPFLNGSLSPYYLVYVDISLLNVQIRNVNNAREISWTSVADRTNHVQFTTSLPPAWNSLFQTNGNGQTITFRDTDNTAQSRFYRVTVD